MNVTTQYRMSVYLTEQLAQEWDAYKREHPRQSFNGLVLELLKERICVTAATSLTTK